jgi:hypothetical protein
MSFRRTKGTQLETRELAFQVQDHWHTATPAPMDRRVLTDMVRGLSTLTRSVDPSYPCGIWPIVPVVFLQTTAAIVLLEVPSIRLTHD